MSNNNTQMRDTLAAVTQFFVDWKLYVDIHHTSESEGPDAAVAAWDELVELSETIKIGSYNTKGGFFGPNFIPWVANVAKTDKQWAAKACAEAGWPFDTDWLLAVDGSFDYNPITGIFSMLLPTQTDQGETS